MEKLVVSKILDWYSSIHIMKYQFVLKRKMYIHDYSFEVSNALIQKKKADQKHAKMALTSEVLRNELNLTS